MTTLTTSQLFGGNLFKPQLHGGVPIVFCCTNCRYKAGTSLVDSHGSNFPVRVKDLAHAYFLTDNALHGTSEGTVFERSCGLRPYHHPGSIMPRLLCLFIASAREAACLPGLYLDFAVHPGGQ